MARKTKAKPATLSEYEIESVDYANAMVRDVPPRSFSQTIARLERDEMELAYRRSGVIFKGINRKARDPIRKGYKLKPDVPNLEHEAELNAAARIWTRKVGWESKKQQALREAYAFGDGFLELAYDDKKPSNTPPAPSAVPVAVFNVDPYAVLPVKDANGRIAMYLTGENVRDNVPLETARAWLAGRAKLPAKVSPVHPDRLVHYQPNAIRDDPRGLGIGVIEPAYFAALGKLAGDRTAGDMLEWYAKGFFVLNIEGATPLELREATKMLEAAKRARKNYFVGSERATFDVKSPAAVNFKPFYDTFYVELACALEMPTLLLLGVQKGSVTGSETDLLEYYDDVATVQRLMLEPAELRVLQRVLKATDFSIEWTPLYVNKQTEADLRFKDAQSAAQLYGAGILSRREAVAYLRDGTLPLPDEVPEKYGDGAPPPGPVSVAAPAQPPPEEAA